MLDFKIIASGRSLLVCFLAVSVVLNAALVSAKSGDLDLSFGAGAGVVKVPPLDASNNWDTPNAVARYSDGRIVQVGQCADGTSYYARPKFCIRRFMANGDVEAGFGTNGLLLPFAAYNFTYGGAFSVAILPDKRALVFGTCRGPELNLQPGFPPSLRNEQFACAVRLNADGTLDSTFGSSGKLFFAIHNLAGVSFAYSSADALTLLPDGRFMVAGGCSQSSANLQPRFCVSRHLSNGTFDTTFANAGWKIVTFSGVSGQETVTSIVAASDGASLVAGNCSDSSSPRAACAFRLDAVGALLTTFAGNGRFTAIGMELSAIAKTNDAAIPPSGTLMIFGYCNRVAPATGQFSCARKIDVDRGTVDSSIGVNGILSISTFGTENSLYGNRLPTIYSAAQWHDESIIMLGACSPNPPIPFFGSVFCLAKLAPNGAADYAFGSIGIAQVSGTEGGAYPLPNAMFSDYLNKTVVASGRCDEPTGLGFCMARIVLSGSYFDLDANTTTQPVNDGVLYLRYLLGYKDVALTTGALGIYADRTTGSDITTYFSTPNAVYPNCSASIVGAPGGPRAMLDGIVLIRVMLGLTGGAVTNGINFPVGTTRSTWVDIRAHLLTNCGMALN